MVAALTVAAALGGGVPRPDPAELHRAAVVVDTHIDTVQRAFFEGTDLSARGATGHADFPRLAEGGVDVPFFALWVDRLYAGQAAVDRVLELRATMDRVLAANHGVAGLARSASDIDRLVGEGKIAVVLTVEGGHALDGSLDVLRRLHDLGVLSMTLTHTNSNDIGDAAGDPPRWHGLSPFGLEVVAEMNRLGMVIDVSHVSDETFAAALAASRAPVIASHSGCRALCGHRRNLTDDQLRALAAKGGVVGITFVPQFLDEGYRKAYDAAKAERREVGKVGKAGTAPAPPPVKLERPLDRRAWASYRDFGAGLEGIEPPGVERVLDHIDHAVRVAGIDHVGIGSDFDGIGATPRGLEDAGRMPALTRGLLARGYRPDDVRKVLGGNFLRVMREVTGK